MPEPPYIFNVTDKNSAYYKQVKLSQNIVDSLTDEQAWIADFWDDNPFKLNVSGHLMFGTKKIFTYQVTGWESWELLQKIRRGF